MRRESWYGEHLSIMGDARLNNIESPDTSANSRYAKCADDILRLELADEIGLIFHLRQKRFLTRPNAKNMKMVVFSFGAPTEALRPEHFLRVTSFAVSWCIVQWSLSSVRQLLCELHRHSSEPAMVFTCLVNFIKFLYSIRKTIQRRSNAKD